jgi:hypothetical protein
VALLVYEVGFGADWHKVGGKTAHNPGWDLEETRQKLGGDEVSIEKDGCHYQFSLRAWRDVPPDAWRVVPLLVGREATFGPFFSQWETLQELRRRFGGDRGLVTDPDGHPHMVSLAPWSELPETTRVFVRFAPQYDRGRSWWRRMQLRLLHSAVEWERAKGTDPSPRRWTPSRGIRHRRSKPSDTA